MSPFENILINFIRDSVFAPLRLLFKHVFGSAGKVSKIGFKGSSINAWGKQNNQVTLTLHRTTRKIEMGALGKKLSLAAFCRKGQIAKFMKISLVLMMIFYNWLP